MKIVIVLNCTSHYHTFPTCIAHTINSKYYSQPYYYIYQHAHTQKHLIISKQLTGIMDKVLWPLSSVNKMLGIVIVWIGAVGPLEEHCGVFVH